MELGSKGAKIQAAYTFRKVSRPEPPRSAGERSTPVAAYRLSLRSHKGGNAVDAGLPGPRARPADASGASWKRKSTSSWGGRAMRVVRDGTAIATAMGSHERWVGSGTVTVQAPSVRETAQPFTSQILPPYQAGERGDSGPAARAVPAGAGHRGLRADPARAVGRRAAQPQFDRPG